MREPAFDTYEDDLDDIQTAAELGSQLDPPSRKFYWLTDLQGDGVELAPVRQGFTTMSAPSSSGRCQAGDRKVFL